MDTFLFALPFTPAFLERVLEVLVRQHADVAIRGVVGWLEAEPLHVWSRIPGVHPRSDSRRFHPPLSPGVCSPERAARTWRVCWTGRGPPVTVLAVMCRNIRVLYNFEPPTTEEEIRAAAVQYVRKVSGLQKPPTVDVDTFEMAISEVATTTRWLLRSLRARTAVRTREREREKARERGRRRAAQRSPA